MVSLTLDSGPLHYELPWLNHIVLVGVTVSPAEFSKTDDPPQLGPPVTAAPDRRQPSANEVIQTEVLPAPGVSL